MNDLDDKVQEGVEDLLSLSKNSRELLCPQGISFIFPGEEVILHFL